jgi:undecaprenyl-diphosphatase
MDFIQAIILSIVEGVTEFLPVSSTGHLILASQLLGITQTEFTKTFEIFIQLGGILAVVVIYLKSIWQRKNIWKNIIVSFVPTAVIGLILYKFIKAFLLGNTLVVVYSLLIGGIILIIFEKLVKKRVVVKEIEDLNLKDSFLIGVAQSLSVIPGVSRSASTIVGAMLLGVSREVAVEYSFILAIPTMAAAVGLDLIKSDLHFSSNQFLILLTGFVGAFLTALIVIKWFIKFVKNNTFIPFGIYRIIIALIFWYILFFS